MNEPIFTLAQALADPPGYTGKGASGFEPGPCSACVWSRANINDPMPPRYHVKSCPVRVAAEKLAAERDTQLCLEFTFEMTEMTWAGITACPGLSVSQLIFQAPIYKLL